MTQDDLGWLVELAGVMRERRAPHAPLFWRPAADAMPHHRAYLSWLLDRTDTVTVRTARGYLVGVPTGPDLVVDDFAVEDDAAWPTDGRALLEHVHGEHRLRVVVPVCEPGRRAVAAGLGLEPGTTWWHRDLPDPPDPGADEQEAEAEVAVDGATGRLVVAPPVYDPGGPVLLVTAAVASAAALRRLEQQAARRGATVSVVETQPADTRVPALLEAAGYLRTTDFYRTPPAS